MINGSTINGAQINGSGAGIAQALLSVPSPIGAPALEAFHDWSGAVPPEAVIRYVCDISGGAGLLRVPISSWQATLRTDTSNYVQVVIPAVAQYASEISDRAATGEFIISRRVEFGGTAIEQEMARAPLGNPSLDRGATNYSMTISGYTASPFAAPGDPIAATDRTLQGVRSVSIAGTRRVRASIDWFLRPGWRAVVDDETFVVSWINYYVNNRDAYMDVGEAA